jgi:hypothetical protein
MRSLRAGSNARSSRVHSNPRQALPMARHRQGSEAGGRCGAGQQIGVHVPELLSCAAQQRGKPARQRSVDIVLDEAWSRSMDFEGVRSATTRPRA